jgi:hypothetical protein
MSTIVREQVAGPTAWIGPKLQPEDFQIRLGRADIEDLERATRQVLAAGKKWGEFEREDFDLPVFGPRLREIEQRLRTGLGFVLIKGVPVQRYSLDEIKTMYWGIGAQLGTAVTQNAKRDIIGHVEDIKPAGIDDPNFRPYQNTAELDPHCDYADLVGLLCVDRAASGGRSSLASSVSVYNRIVREHPEYLETLYEGFYHALRGEGPTGDPRETAPVAVPIYHWNNDRLWCWFHRKIIRLGMQYREVGLTPLQQEVFDFIEASGRDPELRLDMYLEPGDLQFVNNYTTLHFRTQYQDDEQHHRLLLRLWLNLRGEDQLDSEIARWVRRGIPGKVPA